MGLKPNLQTKIFNNFQEKKHRKNQRNESNVFGLRKSKFTRRFKDQTKVNMLS